MAGSVRAPPTPVAATPEGPRSAARVPLVAALDPEQIAGMYERVGGDAWFVGLVDRFYVGVVEDPRLRVMYPEDLTESKAHLTGFLIQYWGGPTTYSEQRGHPRLRMRHVPFVIGPAERDAWFDAMAAAVMAGGLDPEDRDAFLAYFEMAANAMVNQQP
jgi:hemoglobin